MTASVWNWPALEPGGRSMPERLEVGRAVWGKVHGAASDFRWIAHTSGLDPQDRCLQRELVLGSEDAPRQAVFWRALGRSYCAVSCYQSHAVDAARRSGFLEKQLLEWAPAGEAPAALGALRLLPGVASFTDGVWWSASGDPGWDRPGFALTLEPEPPIDVSTESLSRAALAGLAALREAVEEPALAVFYSAVLAGCRPAVLSGLGEPLPPEGVAALLLPLPRQLADGLSVAGWNVSQRVDAEEFRRRWNVLLCDRAPAALRAVPEPEVSESGREAARAVFEGEPLRLSCRPAGEEATRPVPAAKLPPVLERLRSFAKDPRRRWLSPEDLAAGRPFQITETYEDHLVQSVEMVDQEIARLTGPRDEWKRQHLQVKADVLRAAALALAPSTEARLGLPKSGRVPALFFCSQLGEGGWGRLAELGEDRLDMAVRQSLACESNLFKTMRAWLEAPQRRGTRAGKADLF